jgi:hypothetical protein
LNLSKLAPGNYLLSVYDHNTGNKLKTERVTKLDK